MGLSKIRVTKDTLSDRDLEAICNGEETQRSDDIWNYCEIHRNEAVDLDEYARKRGIKI